MFVPVVIDVGVQHAFHVFGGDVAFDEALGEISGCHNCTIYPVSVSMLHHSRNHIMILIQTQQILHFFIVWFHAAIKFRGISLRSIFVNKKTKINCYLFLLSLHAVKLRINGIRRTCAITISGDVCANELFITAVSLLESEFILVGNVSTRTDLIDILVSLNVGGAV